MRSMAPYATRLASDVRRLRSAIPKTQIEPLDYATRAHEILEDAQRDFMSGVDVPWSHEGVLATAAGVTATRVVINTLRPLLGGQDSLDPVGPDCRELERHAVADPPRPPRPAAAAGRADRRRARTARRQPVVGARAPAAHPGSLETTDPPTDPEAARMKPIDRRRFLAGSLLAGAALATDAARRQRRRRAPADAAAREGLLTAVAVRRAPPGRRRRTRRRRRQPSSPSTPSRPTAARWRSALQALSYKAACWPAASA